MCIRPKNGIMLMLTERIKLNVAHKHHLFVVLIKDGSVNDVGNRGLIARCEKVEGIGHALGCLQQAVTLRILLTAEIIAAAAWVSAAMRSGDGASLACTERAMRSASAAALEPRVVDVVELAGRAITWKQRNS